MLHDGGGRAATPVCIRRRCPATNLIVDACDDPGCAGGAGRAAAAAGGAAGGMIGGITADQARQIVNLPTAGLTTM